MESNSEIVIKHDEEIYPVEKLVEKGQAWLKIYAQYGISGYFPISFLAVGAGLIISFILSK